MKVRSVNYVKSSLFKKICVSLLCFAVILGSGMFFASKAYADDETTSTKLTIKKETDEDTDEEFDFYIWTYYNYKPSLHPNPNPPIPIDGEEPPSPIDYEPTNTFTYVKKEDYNTNVVLEDTEVYGLYKFTLKKDDTAVFNFENASDSGVHPVYTVYENLPEEWKLAISSTYTGTAENFDKTIYAPNGLEGHLVEDTTVTFYNYKNTTDSVKISVTKETDVDTDEVFEFYIWAYQPEPKPPVTPSPQPPVLPGEKVTQQKRQ